MQKHFFLNLNLISSHLPPPSLQMTISSVILLAKPVLNLE